MTESNHDTTPSVLTDTQLPMGNSIYEQLQLSISTQPKPHDSGEAAEPPSNTEDEHNFTTDPTQTARTTRAKRRTARRSTAKPTPSSPAPNMHKPPPRDHFPQPSPTYTIPELIQSGDEHLSHYLRRAQALHKACPADSERDFCIAFMRGIADKTRRNDTMIYLPKIASDQNAGELVADKYKWAYVAQTVKFVISCS
jgi:hypothetical protein